MQLDVDVVTNEVLRMIGRLDRALDVKTFAIPYTQTLRNLFLDQFDEGYEAQKGWAPLSPMRVRERGGSTAPMLQWLGTLRDETAHYKGDIGIAPTFFDYTFPGHEASGRYWGLTAGQRRNPLGLTPLSATPRPLLGDYERQIRDNVLALVLYFRSKGFQVDIA